MQNTIFILIIYFAHLSLNVAQAEIYKTVDENGKIIFTDQQPANAEPIIIKEINTVPAIKKSPVVKSQTQVTDVAEVTYTALAITSPTNNAVIPNGLVPFSVTSRISPSLQPEHQLELFIDGKRYGSSTSNSIKVATIQRGKHSLRLQIIDAEGKRLIKSKAIMIFAYRPGN